MVFRDYTFVVQRKKIRNTIENMLVENNETSFVLLLYTTKRTV